jgi:predicted PurR-regulated permease PerM
MDEKYFNNIMVLVILAVLSILSFFMLRSLLLSVVFGFILVFIFAPVYDGIHKKIKSKNLSATVITLILLLIVFLPMAFLLPMIVNEALKIFMTAQQADFITPLKNLISHLSSSTVMSEQVESMLQSFVNKITSGLVNYLSDFLFNIPNILLQLTVVFFTFFFVIRDKEEFVSYVKSIMPFPRDLKEKLMKATREVTASVLYGQVIIGLVQGLVAGIGFFLFGISNSLLLTVLAIAAGILPIIGPAIVWVPVAIYLLISGNTFTAIGVTIFGIASITIDNFLRPIIVSKRIMMNSLLVLLGMVGGIILFGLLGFILGPLIIAYFIIFLELYRNKKISGLIIEQN